MATTNRGRAIFDALVEYPLPKKDGVRDYVFYFVPSEANHGYGWSARVFFRNFYRNHAAREVSSLEGLINELHLEVTQHGVQQIREIVIVTHANSQAMLFPILAAQPAEFPYVNAETLAAFQKRMSGEFQAFKAKRTAVMAHLQDDSWVTIRGCNFGLAGRLDPPGSPPPLTNEQKHAAMYATYAFFGGRADVYAPTLFQHFAVYPMDQFSRMNTPAKLHAHLVHQHFFQKETTPERKRTVIEDLYQPAMFSAPHQIASRKLTNPDPDEETNYEALVDDLNSGRKSAALLASLAEMMANLSVPGWSPAASATIKTVERNTSWMLRDNLKHDGISYHVYHQIYETVDGNRATLWVQARLEVDDGSSPKDGPPHEVVLEMFLDEHEDDALHGRLFRLAVYTDKDEKPDRRNRFNAVFSLLKANKFADSAIAPGVDLAAELNEQLPEKLVSPQLKLVEPAAWSDTARRVVWSVDDANNHYLIKMENPATRDGAQAHTITVYSHLRADEEFKREIAYLADNATCQDTPGTELAAYFDRLPIDDLLSVVQYLRTPFKPGNAVYIHHAQQAMKRKKDFEQWVMAQHPEINNPAGAVLIDESDWELHAWEKDDIKESSYPFNFNDAWFEVKAFMGITTDSADDLFSESLADKLQIPANSARLDPETDSPAPDVRQPTAFEAPFAANPLETDKALFDEAEDSTAGCEDFEEVITKLAGMSDEDADKILAMLETEKTAGGTKYFDVVVDISKKYSFLRTMARFSFPELSKLPWSRFNPWIPSSQDGLVTEPIKRMLEHELKAELSWWVESEGALAVSTTVLQTGLALVWVWSVVMVPLKMLKHIAEEEEHTDEVWKAIGQLTAMRQWLRRAADVCYLAKNVPDLHAIDVSTPVSTMPFYSGLSFANEPYYIGRYYLEQWEEDPNRGVSFFTWAPNKMKEGYDHGVDIMKFKVADELVRQAERGVDAALDKMGLDSCRIRVLIKAGMLDLGALQAQVISELADAVRKKLRRL